MKKIYVFIWILYLSFSSILSADASVLKQVSDLYKIEGDYLITFDGKRFPKIAFKSDLHEELAYKLKDSNCTESIYHAYESHILPVVTPEYLGAFNRALLQTCQLLGTLESRSGRALSKALKQEKFPLEKYPEALSRFVRELQFADLVQEKSTQGPLRIVITTTTASGGNFSVAMALKGYLDLFPDQFDAIVIDNETLASQFDPIRIATGKYTTDSLYRLLQEQSCVNELVIAKDRMCQEVAKYIPHRTGEETKKFIKALRPDLIISTRSYYTDDFNLLTLNVPFRMLNCDHQICCFYQDLVGKLDPDLAKFWLPSASPRFFKALFTHFQQEDQYVPDDDWHTLIGKIAQMTHSSFEEAEGQFEVLGFPIRLEFKKEREPTVLSEMKAKWDLKQEEKGILVEMGANGVGVLEQIFELLKSSSAHSIPIKYFFVCGRNQDLQNKLQLKLEQESFAQTALRRCAILGYVDAQSKNELMNVCSLMIAKPGGATQAEVTEMELPMLIMHIHQFWEQANKEKLMQNGLAYEYNPHLPMTTQIEEILEKIKDPVPYMKDPDWKAILLEKLHQTYPAPF